MESFLLLNITSTELLACNHCRMYLRAIFLSDIVTGDGEYILDSAWNGAPYVTPHKLQSWPHYGKPPKSSWDIWRKWLKTAFLGRGGRLRIPLGQWHRLDQHWPWYLSDDGSLVQLSEGQWFSHAPVLCCNRLPTFIMTKRPCEKPSTVQRATVYFKGDQIVCTGADVIKPPQDLQPKSFSSFLIEDTALQWCMHRIQVQQEGQRLLDALQEGTVMAVSDGSYKDTYGTAAWTIGDQDEFSILSGRVVCPGTDDDHNLYRSELAGIYAITAIMNKLCEYYQIHEGTVEIGCDGQSALKTAFDYGVYLSKDIPSYDLVAAILRMRKNSPLTWKTRFIKGHQDDGDGPLDTRARRNIMMDLWAKQHLEVAFRTPRHYSVSGEPWQIWLGERKLTSRLLPQLYAFVHQTDGLQYWATKPDLSSDVLAKVDWALIGHSMRGVKRGRRVFVTKHVAGMCRVGKLMLRWKRWDTDKCPRCCAREEASHV
jgi:hypothetical protein